MKHSHFEDLITKAGPEVELSTTERNNMRSFLNEYVVFKPLRVSRAVPSHQTFFSSWILFMRHPAMSLAVVVLVVAVGSGGVAFAAEGTLPGDTLYPVKVRVTEPLRTSLALSTEAKVVWHRTLAERRLSEAAVLADQGRLGTTTEAALAENFEYNADAAASEYDNDSRAVGAADIAATNFGARLSAYENILARADEKKGRDATAALRGVIRAQIARVASTTANIKADARETTTASSTTAAPAAHTDEREMQRERRSRPSTNSTTSTTVTVTTTSTSDAGSVERTNQTENVSSPLPLPPVIPPIPTIRPGL